MLTSVIICTYNRAALLKRALHALSCQTLPPDQFEVIVVDDGSHDATPEICAMMGRKLPNMRYLRHAQNLGLGSAANVGIKAAQGELCLFTDDDCLPDMDWAAQMRAALQCEPIVAGAVASPPRPYLKLCHNIATFHNVMAGKRTQYTEFIAGANMGMQREVFEQVGLFQEGRRTASDMEWILRARRHGHRVYFAPDALVVHDPARAAVASLLRYAAKHAAATIQLRQQYRTLLQTPVVLQSPGLLLLSAPLIALYVTMKIYWHNERLRHHLWYTPLVVYGLKLAWCWGAACGLQQRKHMMLSERKEL